ncbi:MAG: hypothetical protein AB1547_16055, partial [Thermodesulfobacteriota bacterium]
IGRTYWIEISIEKQAVAIQPASVCCMAIRPILRDRAAEFFRSGEKGSPVTPRLYRDFLTFCGAISHISTTSAVNLGPFPAIFPIRIGILAILSV